jgi:leucine dehydrogenase
MDATKNTNANISIQPQQGSAMTKELKKIKHTSLDRLFRYSEALDFGDVHFKFDKSTGLRAIVAIHNLNRGPAIGGCRCIHYQTTDEALEDALRLAQMMSLKAAISRLNHGGAKSVLIKPKVIKDRKAYFESFGEFIESLGGRYITAMDSGTNEKDMDYIANRTKFVTCTTGSQNSGDPSPMTALGVRRGIEASVKFKMNRDNIDGIHVAIQGVGHVGYYLAKELHALGARMTICDVNQQNIQRCVDEFGVKVVAPLEIYDVKADVFAPCALGSVLNLETIKRLQVPIVAGSANNQLAHRHHAQLLHERGILYAPDFVINSGGLINVAVIYDHADMEESMEQIRNIYNTLIEIYERAKKENRSTNEVAEQMAKELLG